mmetsp:Transcript_107345/g.334579  ORF Transcript_107345/g.334579 Transcript_107345/m.334579 type:complete len:833 (+) Transcript_107345:95-2593(+)
MPAARGLGAREAPAAWLHSASAEGPPPEVDAACKADAHCHGGAVPLRRFPRGAGGASPAGAAAPARWRPAGLAAVGLLILAVSDSAPRGLTAPPRRPGGAGTGASSRPCPRQERWGRRGQSPTRIHRLATGPGGDVADDVMRAMEGTITDHQMKQARLRRTTGTWRRESKSWTPPPAVLSEGEVLVRNVKHGPNLLTTDATEFPPYNDIHPEHLDRGIVWMAKSQGHTLWKLWYIDVRLNITWDVLMHPLEVAQDKVERLYCTVRHVRNVMDYSSPKVQKAWKQAVRVRWSTLKRLYNTEKFIPFFKCLLRNGQDNEAQRRIVSSLLIRFEQMGVNIQELGRYRHDVKQHIMFRFGQNDIHNISQEWETNIINDMARKSFLVRDRTELDGVPVHVFGDAADAAVQAGYPQATLEAGPWMVTMDDAMTDPILKHAKGRTFREFVYGTKKRIAFLGGSGKGDNTPLLTELLKLRAKYASLLGQASWAQLEFTSRMSTLQQAYGFLARLRRESLPVARAELHELQEFATSQGATYELEHFDVPYWRERLLESRFSLREGYLREFFPLPAVLDGLFGLLRTLFGVETVAADGEAQVWDKHVRFFRLREADTGAFVASFFLDPFRRRGKKRPGFWVEVIQEYSPLLGDARSGHRRPAVHVVCDLDRPRAEGGPALLTHEEVARLFHTVGQTLRHLLCSPTEGLAAGTQGMEYDVREMPAYFLERWAYDKSTIRSMSRHVETGDPLPEAAIETLAASRTFHNGMRVLRRTGIAQIDLDLHAQYEPAGEMDVNVVAKLIEAEFSVIPPRVEDHELCSLPIEGERASAFFCRTLGGSSSC